jgi:type II secretory pathway pseudopilin PulG
LIEVLVVVAIIALLVSILLPSLSRARAQARMVLCQSNIKQVCNAFAMYAVDTKGRFPGARGDNEADWLGGSNSSGGQPKIYGPSGSRGRMPEWGTIYRYMNKQKFAYVCPDDRVPRTSDPRSPQYYSYTSNLLLSGAKPEMAIGGHVPREAGPPPFLANYDRGNNPSDHRSNMQALDGAPLIIEEHEDVNLQSTNSDDSGWSNQDTITARHLTSRNKGWGNLGYVDGHVGRIESYLIPKSAPFPAAQYMAANWFCIRVSARKWVSGRQWDKNGDGIGKPMYKYLDGAPDAGQPVGSVAKVLH